MNNKILEYLESTRDTDIKNTAIDIVKNDKDVKGVHTKHDIQILITKLEDTVEDYTPGVSIFLGKLYYFGMQSDVSKHFDITSYLEYVKYHAKTNNRVLNELLNTKSNSKLKNDLIEHFDRLLSNPHIQNKSITYSSMLNYVKKYLRHTGDRDNRTIVELPIHIHLSHVMLMVTDLEQYFDNNTLYYFALETLDTLLSYGTVLSTPYQSKARTTYKYYSSCFVETVTADSLEAIMESNRSFSVIAQLGGGHGIDISAIRQLGADIRGVPNSARGVVPFLCVTNATAKAVDQLGVRNGSTSPSLSIWHGDIEQFLDLKKQHGDPSTRTFDLFPAIWIDDVFMKKVENREEWHYYIDSRVYGKELYNKYGDEFETTYNRLVSDGKYISKVSLEYLWKKILSAMFGTGSPFIGFKDNANNVSAHNKSGVIRSTNLCTEIFQNTYIHATDDSEATDKTILCNLSSVNMGIIKVGDWKTLETYVKTAVYMLNSFLDTADYKVEEWRIENTETARAIGIGLMGEADWCAYNKIVYGSDEHNTKLDEFMRYFNYYVYKASVSFGKLTGRTPTMNKKSRYTDRDYVLSKIPMCETDTELLDDIVSGKLANAYLMAIAPTSTISLLASATSSIEPIYDNSWNEKNISGTYKVVPKYMSNDKEKYYTKASDLDQMKLVMLTATRTKYIDQGQSFNLFISPDKHTISTLSNIVMSAWKEGVKSIYYVRSKSPAIDVAVDGNKTSDDNIQCEGCQ